MAALWWRTRRGFEQQVAQLRTQFENQRSSTVEQLEHARSQIDLLQSELAEARRREDRLRATQAERQRSQASAMRTAANLNTASGTMMVRRHAMTALPRTSAAANHGLWVTDMQT